MATSVRQPPTLAEEEVRILPPEHGGPPTGALPRPVAWIAAFFVAVLALVAVVVVEEIRISDRDDTIATLERDVALQGDRIEAQRAVIRDLKLQLTAALEQGTVADARVDRLRTDLAVMEAQLARSDARQAIFQARADAFGSRVDRLQLALTTWVPPVTDGAYSGRMLGVNATADPPRIAFEAIETENAGGWMMLPVSPTAEITVWSFPIATSQERTEDLAFLDRMFSTDSPWAESHRSAWYEIVVLDGEVTEIHEGRPAP